MLTLAPCPPTHPILPRRGTSMAAPMVSGSVALLWAAALAAGHNVTYPDIKAALLNGVEPFISTITGQK